MKQFFLYAIICVLCIGLVNAQGEYIQIPPEYFTPFDDDGAKIFSIKVRENEPWYVFSDKDGNPVNNNSGQVIQNVELGKSFLVIGLNGNNLEVIDANSVEIDRRSGTWKLSSGANAGSVLRGFMAMNNLVPSMKCLKVSDAGLPGVSKGKYDLQSLFIYDVAKAASSYNFLHVPNDNNSKATPISPTDKFGYVYKKKNVNGITWFLVGSKPEIRYGSTETILLGWKPQTQILEWKHKRAVEYNWENPTPDNRHDSEIRLAVLKQHHSPSTNISVIQNVVDREYCYLNDPPCLNHYYYRDDGTATRFVILGAQDDDPCLKVGVFRTLRADDIDVNSGVNTTADIDNSRIKNNIVNIAWQVSNRIVEEIYKPNVIFVLDGTESIIANPVRKDAILNTIETTMNKIEDGLAGTSIAYNYGASIYRDKSYGDFLFESTEWLSTDIGEVNDWIEDNLIVKPGGKGDDQPEAIFYGLNETFQIFQEEVDYFNPTFYVVIGDAGSHDPDIDDITGEDISESLKMYLSDLVTIQFSHRIDIEDGKPFDLFWEQFNDLYSDLGETVETDLTNGIKLSLANQPGSFFVHPDRGSEFEPDTLAKNVKEALENYNENLQFKINNLATILRKADKKSVGVEGLVTFIRNYLEDNKVAAEYGTDQVIEQIVDWVIRILENMGTRMTSQTVTNRITSVNINTSGSNSEVPAGTFVNPGYICENYDILEHPAIQHVIYYESLNLDQTIDLARRISRPPPDTDIRANIRSAWHFMLGTVLGLFSDSNDIDRLTIKQATSILTGFDASDDYNEITIGEIMSAGIFTNQLALQYMYEWSIIFEYLQSVKNGSWELHEKNLISYQGVINQIRKLNGKALLNSIQLQELSNRFKKKDRHKTIDLYFRNYPYVPIDPKYDVKAYWLETNFFPNRNNNFVEILLNL
jgi:hypothetical protein